MSSMRRSGNPRSNKNDVPIPSGFHLVATTTNSSLQSQHQAALPPPPPPLPGSGILQQSFPYHYNGRFVQHPPAAVATHPWAHPSYYPQNFPPNVLPFGQNPSQLAGNSASYIHNFKRPQECAAVRHQDENGSVMPKSSGTTTQPAKRRKLTGADDHKNNNNNNNPPRPKSGPPTKEKESVRSAHAKFSGSGFKTITVSIPGCPTQRFRICVGNRPEDIQQWIADRKKRFPRQHPNPQIVPDNTATKEDPAVNNNPLSSLLGGYGSSDSEDEEGAKPVVSDAKLLESCEPSAQGSPDPTTNAQHKESTRSNKDSASPTTTKTMKRGVCHSFARHGHCRRGCLCPYQHEKPIKEPPSTLLRKLLKKEMERESVLTIQLLQYLVGSNFLQQRLPPLEQESPPK